MYRLKKLWVQMRNKGFLHIIISSTLVKVVSMMSAMFLPRIISSKVDYGLLTYVDNIRNYILLLNGLGMANAALKFCATDESQEKRKGYFLVSLGIGIGFDIILTIGTVIYYLTADFQFDGAREYLLAMSLLPILSFLFDDIQIMLRACFENKKFSFLSFAYALLSLTCQIGLAWIWSLKGVVAGRYISLILSIAFGVFLLLTLPLIKQKHEWPSIKIIKKMITFAIIMLIGNVSSSIMQLNETFIIGQVLHDEIALADYKVASYILSMSLFFVQSVVIFIFPYFSRHSNDKKWVWQNFKKISLLNAAFMIPLHLILILCSRWIIIIIFGVKYVNVTGIMQTLLIASLGQSLFRGIVGNILVAVDEEKFNLKINILFTIVHFIVDYIAVYKFGLAGAAISLTIVYYLSGVIMIWHLRKVCIREELSV